ncbi:MAG TPA: tetratricopeptide repeat protein [Verrucomicrobiae bacterium]|nr:tetratricopeptide repeat protein [Verrucomicrobiae bacterium]
MTPTRTSLTWCALALSALLLAGCASTPTALKEDGNEAARNADSKLTAKEREERSTRRVEAQARYTAGLAHELRREADKALEEFFKSVQADPSNEDLALEVSRRLLLKKDLPRALEIGKLAATQPGASAMAHAHLAVLFAEAGQLAEAERANRKAIALAPDSLVSYYNLYTLHLSQKQPDKAQAVLDEAAARPVETADYWLDLAELYANLQRNNPADPEAVLASLKQCLNRAEELGVRGPARQQKLADGYVLAGEVPRAVEILLEVLEDAGEDARIRDLVRQKLVALYITSQDADGALEQLESMVRDHPTNPQANFLLATVAYEKQDTAKAIDYFRKTLQLNPDFEQAYYSLTTVLLETDQDQAAAALLVTAREKYPQSFVASYFSAVAASRLEDHAAAVEHYTAAEVIAKATAPNRLDHVFYFQMGAQLERAQRFEEAAATFKQCLGLKSDFAPALNYLGYMWADQGVQLEEARKLIQQAVDLEPENAAYLDSLAWVLFKLDQPHLALTYMERALQHQEEPDATLFDHLGDIQQAAGNPKAAREAWKKSLEITDDPKVREKLDQAGTPTGETGP